MWPGFRHKSTPNAPATQMNLAKPTTLAATALAAGLFLLPASHAAAQSAAATPAVSSSAPPAPPNADKPPGNRDDFRQRMAERIKTQLKVSDDEWTVIQPLLEKVGEKLLANRTGGFGGPGGPGGNRGGGRNNGGGNQPATTDNAQGGGNQNQRREGGGGGPRGGSPETQALGATLADDNSTVNDVKAKLQAVRDQRKQANAELAQAREELRKVLNMRQEAFLVMDGILD